MDSFKWTVRVAGVEGGTAAAFARRHRFSIGAPVQFDEAYGAISGVEYLLGALGAELVNGFRELAGRRRLAVDRVEAVVEGQLGDPLAYLGVVGSAGNPGLESASVKLYVSSPEDEGPLRSVWEDLQARAPLVRTLAPVVHLKLRLEITL